MLLRLAVGSGLRGHICSLWVGGRWKGSQVASSSHWFHIRHGCNHLRLSVTRMCSVVIGKREVGVTYIGIYYIACEQDS